MPRKASPKKSKPTAAAKKVNKSAWIRAQPSTMSAADVVAKGKVEGIALTANQVYTTRSNAKTAKTFKGKSASKGKKPAAIGGNAEQLIRRAALMVGIEGIESLVKKIRTEAGL